MSIFNNKFKSTDIYGAFKVVDYAGILGVGAVPASFDISGNGVFRGSSIQFTNLPTCTQTPTTGTQLITKAFADATYTGTDITVLNNTWTGTNTFNSYAPSSSVAPSSANDLCNKTYVDLKAPLASPALTGTPTAPTAAVATNTTQIATTAFVLANQPSLAAYAPLANPALTGVPTAPTAAVATNTTQLATTAFVLANQQSLAAYAPLANPALTGTPTAPTASLGTDTTQLATTAFVLANGASFAPITATFTFYTV